MSLNELFQSPEYLREKDEMPVMRALIERMAAVQPLKGATVVVGQIVAINSITVAEALVRGGADVAVTLVHETVKTKPAGMLLQSFDVPLLSPEQAVFAGDYFVDDAGSLGKIRTPKGASEITRTGDIVYAKIPCPVICVDRTKVKVLETYVGTGMGFVRGWREFRPDVPLKGKRLVQFGYGKVGRGVARRARDEGMEVVIVDVDPAACVKAEQAGYRAVNSRWDPNSVRGALARANVVVGVTGIPGAVGRSVPREWLMANRPTFVNMGYDEFEPAIPGDQMLGGPTLPVNLFLAKPTYNRYIDPTLAALVMGIEALVQHPHRFPVGIHTLPLESDRWILQTWRKAWPDEDISELRDDLAGLIEC